MTNVIIEEKSLQDVIDNKGSIIMELEKSGNNKETMIEFLNTLSDDFPVITCRGLWNNMSAGKLTTKKHLKDWNFDDIYGGKDTFVIYENLIYIKEVDSREMFF